MTTSEMQARIEQLESENESLRGRLERAEEIAGIKRGIEAINQGDVKPLREFDREMRAKHKIPK